MAEETVKNEEKTEEKAEQKPAVELSDKLESIMKSIEELTVVELATLVKALEEKFGVSAAAAVAVAGPVAAAGGAAEEEEEKTSFTVVLAAIGDKKINVIKEIRALTSLGLKEAKELVESAPKAVREGTTKEEADKIKATLEGVGATVEIK